MSSVLRGTYSSLVFHILLSLQAVLCQFYLLNKCIPSHLVKAIFPPMSGQSLKTSPTYTEECNTVGPAIYVKESIYCFPCLKSQENLMCLNTEFRYAALIYIFPPFFSEPFSSCLVDWCNCVSIWHSSWMRTRWNGSSPSPLISQHRSKTGNA